MATAKFIAFKHHKKSDGKINIKLCVYHKGQRVYLNTNYTAVEEWLKKDYSIKDKYLKEKTLADELKYLKKISELGRGIDNMTAKELGEHLLKPSTHAITEVDFIEFSRRHIQLARAAGKTSTANQMQSVVNNLLDFLTPNNDVVYTESITSKLLKRYEDYLSNPYIQTRLNHGKPTKTSRLGMEESSLFTHMNYFKALFNAARDKYNDLDTGKIIINNYPFKAYKAKASKGNEPRAVSISLVKQIRDIQCRPKSGMRLAADIFMLSFYMLGMNAKDIYNLAVSDGGNRLNYNRSKTHEKRADGAFISVKIIPEAQVLLDKYAGTLSSRYADVFTFRRAIKDGMDDLVVALGVPKFTFYSARHTVATEARNTLGFSVADVGEALNHRRAESRITDAYIRKDWKKIDEIQAGVVALLGPV